MNDDKFGTSKEPLKLKSNAVQLVDNNVIDNLDERKNMGKKLAIKGDSTRGEEIAELLVMMGGKNKYHYRCNELRVGFTIGSDGTICRVTYNLYDEFRVFTLEEFLEKFPFKIHDLVNIPEYESTVGICGMRWDPYSKCVEYMVYRCDDEEWYTAEELLDYNDNPNNTSKNKEEKKINQMSLANCDLDEVEIVLGDRFELKIENGKYYAVRKKSKYPKTYIECCEVIANLKSYAMNEHYTNVNELLQTLQTLLICRNAYWKIAGEGMRLGKPWEPDWTSEKQEKYCICYGDGNIQKSTWRIYNSILAFPTEEMRDVFYENFKDLIEQCKELL